MFGSFWGLNAAEINSAVKCGWVAVDGRLGHSAVVETTVPESASQVLISATYQPYGIGQGTASVHLNATRQVLILPALGDRIAELVNNRASPRKRGIDMFTTVAPCGPVLHVVAHV